eukprot:NODE_67_length_23829_cov_0.557059.p12 type:complete len:252 gc:universal NODE_67_length_23829_cov_0.557059:1511-2266(+)
MAEREIVCGSIAGICAKLAEHPLDTIKTRQQTTGETIFKIGHDLVGEHWKSIYKGVSLPLFGSVIENASLFGLYKFAFNYTDNSIISGGFSGFTTSFLLTPIELVKVRCQVNTLHYHTYDAFNILKEVHRQGIWYHGHVATCTKETLGGIVWFGTYYAYINSIKSPSTSHYFFGGCLAGISYNLLLYPVDVLKSKRQASGLPMGSIIKQMVESRFKIFNGLSMSLIKSIPSSGITFLVYEYASYYYDALNK